MIRNNLNNLNLFIGSVPLSLSLWAIFVSVIIIKLVFMFSQTVPKQRGIYSEILTTEDTQNLNVSSLQFLYLNLGRLHFWTKQRQHHRCQPETKNAKSSR